jgi:hypothetical protein
MVKYAINTNTPEKISLIKDENGCHLRLWQRQQTVYSGISVCNLTGHAWPP